MNTYKAVLVLLLFLAFSSMLLASSSDNYPVIGNIEQALFSTTFTEKPVLERISSIEKHLFGKNYTNDSLDKRTKRINEYLLGNAGNQQDKTFDGYENIESKELDADSFVEFVVQQINESRSYKGLMPLVVDPIARLVAREHAKDLINRGYISYFNLKNQGPDERYTLAGGTGVITEIIKGFQGEDTNKKIKLTQLLAKQLIQAILASSDDSRILYNPYLTHLGFDFFKSKDENEFASVIEFVTKGANLDPLKPTINLSEKILISGKINPPYKFKAVSIAYYEDVTYEENPQAEFNSEDLIPYFPPQDYIAFSDNSKNNLAKIIKGIGIIGAIGAAPFTGGATAVLAPVLLSSIQSGPPKEIPLKGGMKVNSNGEFTGKIELNYQGMTGVYFISVLAELPGINYPIVISRRTVRVTGILPT